MGILKNFVIQLLKNIKKGMFWLGRKIKHVYNVVIKQIWKKKIIFFIILAICGFVFYYFSLKGALLALLFLMFLVYKWDSRIIAILALVSLAVCPFLLIGGKELIAEEMAIYAYYFLVMTVVLQIVELVRERRSTQGGPDRN